MSTTNLPADIDISKQVDFSVIKEDWSRFKLSDGTLLKVRIVLAKLILLGESELGTPNFAGGSQILLTAIVPPNLINKTAPPKANQDVTANDIKQGETLGFESEGKPQWQEYKADIAGIGWIIKVRPELGEVIKLKMYNQFGEPIYWTNVQHVFNVSKG